MPEGSGLVDPLQFTAGAGFLLSAGLGLAARWPRRVVARPGLVLVLVGVVTLAALAALVRPTPLGVRLRGFESLLAHLLAVDTGCGAAW